MSRKTKSGHNCSSFLNREFLFMYEVSELWISVGAVIEVWGWAKQGPRGQRKTWQVRREAL
jgi:hypothetical protein